MKYIIFLIMTLFTAAPAYAQSDWVVVASSTQNNMQWEFKSGSLEFTETKGGINIATVVGRIINTKTSSIDLFKWYVSASDCGKKMGKIVTLNIDGSYRYENDFVFECGSVACTLAETICAAALYTIKKTEEKGL